MSPCSTERECQNYPHSANSPDYALALGLGAGGLIANVFRNPLISRPLHGLLRARSLFEQAPLLLFSADRRICDDAVQVEYEAKDKV
jgi:hypothetical protein